MSKKPPRPGIYDLFPQGVNADIMRQTLCQGCHYNRSYWCCDRNGNEDIVYCAVVNRVVDCLINGGPAPKQLSLIELNQPSLIPGAPPRTHQVVCSRFALKGTVARRKPKPRATKIHPDQLALFG